MPLACSLPYPGRRGRLAVGCSKAFREIGLSACLRSNNVKVVVALGRQGLKAAAGLDRDISVLLIEHDMDVAFALADAITVLHQGQLVTEGRPEVVRTDARALQIYLGNDPRRPTTATS